MLRAYKFRLYPTREQQEFFAKTFGCVRFIYNQMLADRITDYKESQDNQTHKRTFRTPAFYKKQYEWLKEVDSLALANAQLNLDKAYKNFFRDKSVGFPKFKSKKDNHLSYTTNNQKGTVYIENNKIKLPKLKSLVKIKQHRQFCGIIKSVTISKTPTNKYFASILVETNEQLFPKESSVVGVDVGLKEFAVVSNGQRFENPRWLRKSERRLKFLQRSLSRKKKGSNNYLKTREQLAKYHEKIMNQRNDYLHKVSHILTYENQVIVLEDLRVSNMQKNGKLAKAISEVSWAKFRNMVEYKALWRGREVVIAPSNFASSQLCSNCGYRNKDVKNLKVREWVCPSCSSQWDRDVNASLNLMQLALA